MAAGAVLIDLVAVVTDVLVTRNAELRDRLGQAPLVRAGVGVMTGETRLAGRFMDTRLVEFLPVVTRKTEQVPLGAQQRARIGGMRRMAARAFPLCDRHVHVRRFERFLLFLMASVAERRFFLLQYERTDDAMPFMAAVTTVGVLERRVNDLLRQLLKDGVMAIRTRFRRELSLAICGHTADGGQQTAEEKEQ